MRPHIAFLDSNTIDWKELAPGIFSRPLSRDPDTGARTALQRVVPTTPGYKDQPTAHFHGTTEELLVVKGMMAFDSRTWLHGAAYCFHPAHYVHGFKSRVAEETWFVSRVGRDLDFTYVTEPKDDFPYFVGETPPRRDLTLIPAPFGMRWTALKDDAGKVIGKYLVLSRDPVSGEGAIHVRLFPGCSVRLGAFGDNPPNDLKAYAEVFILEGQLTTESGLVFAPGCYCHLQPGAKRPVFTAQGESLFYLCVGGVEGPA
ncbi:MAG: hypothetical protein SFV19_09925 [Rhodospirillaceae bacterium]|nr:hypothetical protein [Rhodospirillaceae bacterium]